MLCSTHKVVEAVVVGMSLNGLGVVRCLGRAGIPTIGVDCAPIKCAARSRYVHQLATCQELKGAALVECLLRLASGAKTKKALFLTSDEQVETVAHHRTELDAGYLIGLPQTTTVELLLNKMSFFLAAKSAGFDVPVSAFATNDQELLMSVKKVGYPCVIKPVAKAPNFLSTFHEKGILCRKREDAERIQIARYDYSVALTVQEWIPGGDKDVCFVLHCFDHASVPLVSFPGRKIRQSPPIIGHTASCKPIDDPRAVEISEAFFRSIRALGLCSMEFKRPPGTNRYVMIEPTVGRTDWQSAVAHINGVPIVRVAYDMLCGLPPQPAAIRRGCRVWVDIESDFRSALFYRRRGELTLGQWLRSIWPPYPALLSLRDPRPFLAYAREFAGRALRKLTHRGRIA